VDTGSPAAPRFRSCRHAAAHGTGRHRNPSPRPPRQALRPHAGRRSPDPAKTDNDFKEHQFTVSDLPPFTAFALKITLTGTNSSYPPLIKDLRGIALAV